MRPGDNVVNGDWLADINTTSAENDNNRAGRQENGSYAKRFRMGVQTDLPRVFHPAAAVARGSFRPFGAV